MVIVLHIYVSLSVDFIITYIWEYEYDDLRFAMYDYMKLCVILRRQIKLTTWAFAVASTHCDSKSIVSLTLIALLRIMICAQSPVLKAMLEGSWSESSSSVVRLHEISRPTLMQLLSFLYGAEGIPLDDVPALTLLLDAGTRFIIEPLRVVCERRLCLAVKPVV